MHAVGIARCVVPVASILQQQRDLGLARNEIECRPQPALVVVLDLDHAEQPAIRLPRGQPMRVRVVPVKRRPVPDLEVVRIVLTRRGELHSSAVVARVDCQSVPMDDRGLGNGIVEVELHALSRTQHQRRVDVLLAAMLDPEPQRPRPGIGSAETCGLQAQPRAIGREPAEYSARTWDEQRAPGHAGAAEVAGRRRAGCRGMIRQRAAWQGREAQRAECPEQIATSSRYHSIGP